MSAPDSRFPARLSELRFLFQPVVALDGDDDWAEALVRWFLPDGTVRGPLELLPYWLAEPRRGTFTRYTLARAAQALGAAPTGSVSVNLSPQQVVHPQTIAFIEAMLPEIRTRLRLEVTEQRVRSARTLRAALDELRPHCAALLLDDVTPDDLDLRSRVCDAVDGVKLDRSVVMALLQPERATAMRRFVSDACARFATVVAEGIEDAAQCDALRALGVTHVQGFAIGKPRAELAGVRTDRRVRFEPTHEPPGATPDRAERDR